MKWGGNSNKAADKLTEAIGKIFGAKGLSILLSIATFALLVSAGVKWGY
jgi:hypothetical protein